MTDDLRIALQIGEATIYADTVADFAHALTHIEAEKIGRGGYGMWADPRIKQQ